MNEIAEICDSYDINPDFGGADQAAFSNEGRTSKTRTQKLADWVLEKKWLNKSGKLIDIGCGSGTALEAFGELLASWELFGLDLSDNYESRLQKIPNFQTLFVGDICNVYVEFDLVILVHTLEHVFNPQKFLQEIKKLTSPGGYLFIQVPNLSTAPFDILIADHVLHFTSFHLVELLNQTGWEVLRLSENLINKEISVVCRIAHNVSNLKIDQADTELILDGQLQWLTNFATVVNQRACQAKKNGKKLGVFGTANAAAWTTKILSTEVDFYIDEDQARENSRFLKKRVYTPTNCPTGSCVVLPFPFKVANRIASQYNEEIKEFVMPDSAF